MRKAENGPHASAKANDFATNENKRSELNNVYNNFKFCDITDIINSILLFQISTISVVSSVLSILSILLLIY